MSKVHRLVLIAMLSAVSTILAYPMLQFPLLPAADFLKVDFTILPILVGVFTIGLNAGFIILLIRSILWLLLFNKGPTTWIGLPMNMIVIAIFMVILWLFIRKKATILKIITGGIVGTLIFTAAMVIMNLIYAIPLFVKFASTEHFDYGSFFYDPSFQFYVGIKNYILTMVFPFNLIEGVLFTVAFALIFLLLRKNKIIKFYNI